MSTEEERPSKSELKRRALGAQALGRRLTELSAVELESIPLDDQLRKALADYARITRKEARRRQLQFIGRLMRDADQSAIAAAVAAIDHTSARQKQRHKQLETWRERLLTEPESLTAYVADHPDTDVKALRDLLARHAHARDEQEAKRLGRKLYRLLQAADHRTLVDE